jgi:hypothetical protein
LKGARVYLHIDNADQVPVTVGAGIFDVADGEFCFAKGSSGWTRPDGLKVEFAEVVKRGGNASAAFDRPRGGSKIEWRPVPK